MLHECVQEHTVNLSENDPQVKRWTARELYFILEGLLLGFHSSQLVVIVSVLLLVDGQVYI